MTIYVHCIAVDVESYSQISVLQFRSHISFVVHTHAHSSSLNFSHRLGINCNPCALHTCCCRTGCVLCLHFAMCVVRDMNNWSRVEYIVLFLDRNNAQSTDITYHLSRVWFWPTPLRFKLVFHMNAVELISSRLISSRSHGTQCKSEWCVLLFEIM